MTNDLSVLDLAKAHHFFSADCFNRTWAILDKIERSVQDDEQMVLMSMTSLWHWTQRKDCTDQTLSIGYWQVSRVYSTLGQAENAQIFGERCLGVSGSLSPFFLGYAHEALASEEARDSELIDPEDSRPIGWLIAMTGGTIADAAVARYALERFEQIHGRKATTSDVGIVVGLMGGGNALTGGEDSKN